MARTLLIFAFVLISFSGNTISIASENSAFEHPDAETYNKMVGEYARLIDVLVPNDSVLKALYATPLLREKIWLMDQTLDSADGKIWLASLYQPLTLTFFHSSLKLRSVQNYALEEYFKAHKDQTQSVPSLTPDQAVARGRKYLMDVGMVVPPNYRLEKIDFNSSNHSMWTIRWNRYAGEFAYDTNQLLTNDALISFHETMGIGTCAVHSYLPEPTSLDVKIPCEDAVIKASKVVPLIEKTDYYLRGRVPGFVVKSLKEAALRVVAPNWLLDPARATWLRDKVPSEVRLCWIIRFTTVNSKPEPDPKYHLIPPEIIVYVDASTGEIVGGTFT